jgi:glycosyltransferase involved in cell wall biosynthesis
MFNRVLYVFGGEKASGAEVVIERLILNNRVDSHIFIAPGAFASSLLSQNKPYKINIIEKLKKLNRSSSIALFFYLRAVYNYLYISYLTFRYIKKHNIDVVHSNVIGPASYLLPLILISPLLCANVKWVWSDHDLRYYYPLDSFLSKMCSRFYDITFVVSEAVKKKYKANTKIIVLYNGLNCLDFKSDLSQRDSFRSIQKYGNHNIVIGCVGVISVRKGQLGLMRVFKVLREKNPNLQLALAGLFGEDDREYNSECEALLSLPGIKYYGHVSDVASFYNGCDIIISNSDLRGSEPLGTTIYEAMACEKVVIASDTGGTMEIIDNNVNGYLFQADDLQALTTRLGEVVDNYHNQLHIKTAAREKVLRKFNVDVMAANYKANLNRLAIK